MHDPDEWTPYYWTCSCGARSEGVVFYSRIAQLDAFEHRNGRADHLVSIGAKWEGDPYYIARHLTLPSGLDPGPNVPPPEPKREPARSK